jgi:parvulin-like peptidyl-prolyl isomerase
MGTYSFYGVNSMPSLRTKSISTKVTDEEFVQLEALAGEQTISEWARDVLLKATKPNAGEQTMLAEVLALRTILLNVHFAVSQGQTLTAEEMRQLIERADQNKLGKAQQLLAEAATGGMP